MKLLTDLSGKAAEGSLPEHRGVLQTVHDEPRPGLLRTVALGPAGVFFKCGDAMVAIPIGELWKIAEQAEPGLHPPLQPAAKEMLAKR